MFPLFIRRGMSLLRLSFPLVFRDVLFGRPKALSTFLVLLTPPKFRRATRGTLSHWLWRLIWSFRFAAPGAKLRAHSPGFPTARHPFPSLSFFFFKLQTPLSLVCYPLFSFLSLLSLSLCLPGFFGPALPKYWPSVFVVLSLPPHPPCFRGLAHPDHPVERGCVLGPLFVPLDYGFSPRRFRLCFFIIPPPAVDSPVPACAPFCPPHR